MRKYMADQMDTIEHGWEPVQDPKEVEVDL